MIKECGQLISFAISGGLNARVQSHRTTFWI